MATDYRGLDPTVLLKLQTYFSQNFTNFSITDMGISLNVLLTIPYYTDTEPFARWKKENQEKCKLIIETFQIEVDNSELLCIIEILWDIQQIVGGHLAYRPEFAKRKKQGKENNRLADFLKQLKFQSTHDLFEKNEIREIHFIQNAGQTIKISDRYILNNILLLLKSSDLISIEDEYMSWKTVTNLRQQTSAMLHKYFIDNSNIDLKEGSKTSNKICKIISELFFFTHVLNPEEMDNTTPENYIRILINRATFD